MKLIDLSQPIWDGSPNCPSHPAPRVEILADHSQAATSSEPTWHMELVSMASHTGSHLDAPLHKMPGGAAIDDLPLESFVGRAFIADLRFLRAEQEITPALLQRSLPQVLGEGAGEGAIVLLATGWGHKRAKTDEWHYGAPFLGADGARWIVERGARGVGIDHYSVGGAQEPRNAQTHEILLGQNVWIVEELRFPEQVFGMPGPHKFWALPINLKSHSGAWCRPVLEIQ